MYRSALVALKPDHSNDAVVQHAVDLAKRHRWRLAGISVLDRDRVIPVEAVPLGGTAYKASRDEAVLARTREKAAMAVATFQQACDVAGVPAETISLEDDLSRGLAGTVQRFDILMLGHTSGTEAGERPDESSPLAGILKHCSRPAIVVPAIATNGISVVVAYDASLQAARALEAFVASGLESQAPIHVVSVHEDRPMAAQIASVAVEFLQSYGRLATPHGEVPNQSTATMILDFVTRHSAKLLVMGAYGKLTVSEFIFGSVTRTILRTVALPMFLDH